MTTRGRPPIGPPLTVRLPDAMHKRLERLAAKAECSVAEIIRQAIEAFRP